MSDHASREVEAARLGALERMRGLAAASPRACLWALFAACVLVRFPLMLRAPTLYAEEGVVYFRYAVEHGVLAALGARHLGYYSAFSNAAGALAASVPLGLAPYAATCLGLVPPCACAHLVITLPTSLRARAASLALLVFTLTMRAEWASTIHAQFWLAVAMILLLAHAPSPSRTERGFRAALVLVSASTGVVSCLLAPVFFLAGAMRRERRLVAIALVLGAALVAHALSGVDRHPTYGPGQLVCVVLLKLAVFPFVGVLGDASGAALYARADEPLVFVALSALLCAYVAFVLTQTRARWRWVVIASLFIGCVSLFFALPPYAALATAIPGMRYAFAGVVPVSIALVSNTDTQGRAARGIVTVLSSLAVLCGVVSGAKLTHERLSSPSTFTADAARFATDRGVTMMLQQPRCRVSVNAGAQRAGFTVSAPRQTVGGSVVVHVTPGHFDRAAHVGVFVLARARGQDDRYVLAREGWLRRELTYYGEGRSETAGRCYGSEDAALVPPVATFRGATYALVLERATLAALPDDMDELFIGYGRDFADAIAKGTFRGFSRADFAVPAR